MNDDPMHFEQHDGLPPQTVFGFSLDENAPELLNIDDYMGLAVTTLSKCVRDSWKDTMLNAATGISSESGEINEIIKKHFFHFHPMNEEMINHMRKETGDLLWYVMLLCFAMRWRPSTVLAENIEKLKKRYPEGFSTERSMNRAPGDI